MAPNFASRDAVVQSWYVAVPSRTLRAGQIRGFDLQGRRMIAFREPSGQARVLDARCAHMGADLRHGRVEGGSVACALHGWRWNGETGACETTPGRRLRAYPTVERFGHVFFFNGPEPTHDLPEPFYGGRGMTRRLPPQRSPVQVHVVTGNPLDATHFGPLHHADLDQTSLAVLDKHRVQARVRGRLTGGWGRWIPGGRRAFDATFTTIGASNVVGEVVAPVPFTVLFSGRPQEGGGTLIHAVFSMPPGRAWDLPRAMAFALAITADDEDVLSDLDFLPGFTERDAGMRAFHDLVNAMETY